MCERYAGNVVAEFLLSSVSLNVVTCLCREDVVTVFVVNFAFLSIVSELTGQEVVSGFTCYITQHHTTSHYITSLWSVCN